MRAIKFRAWDPERKEMMDFERIKQTTLYHLQMAKEDLGWETMQFTNLHDKNGKEIYEGDVLEDAEGFRAKISFFQGAFSADFSVKNKYPVLLYNHTYMAVIGNIYENPELLKEESK
jgi:hypothetical protein